jgi:hypothetical protein
MLPQPAGDDFGAGGWSSPVAGTRQPHPVGEATSQEVTVSQVRVHNFSVSLDGFVVPIVLGRGERLRDGLEALEDRFQIEAVNSPSGVTHVTFSRR